MMIRTSSCTTLGCLLEGLVAALPADVAALTINDIHLDSRELGSGDLFVALRGAQTDGHDFIEQAAAAGAVAVLAEHVVTSASLPVIVVEHLALQLSEIAGRFYGHPSQQMQLLGVTGTNGKTTCTQLAMQLLNALGKHCAVIGTLGNGVDGKLEQSLNTTPDAIRTQRMLAAWRQDAIDYAAMEVSSHGLVMGRVAAIDFSVALFTNLSRDHLDFHGDMASYADAKARLFQQPGLQVAVINRDDQYAPLFIDAVPSGVRVITYSCSDHTADVYVTSLAATSMGVDAVLHSPWGSAPIHSPLLGAFNLANLLGVLASLLAMGLSLKALADAVMMLKPVAGRMQRFGDASSPVVIDYAHSPEALRSALQALRMHCKGKLWCVFGCGGDRDKGKRPEMGVVAESLADEVIVTSDNPRNEKPEAIVADILAGMQQTPRVELDRSAAIAEAVALAAPGDVVLVAGKGHEDYQEVAGKRTPFDDSEQVTIALAKRGRA